MLFSETENYAFIPNRQRPGTGTFYHLGPESTYQPNSLVVLPYKNPQAQKPRAKFYPIKKQEELKTPGIRENKSSLLLKVRTPKEKYIQTVLKLKEHIQRGNIYEINYCIEFYADDVAIDPLNVFLKLDELAKAPYSMLLKTGDDYVICSSPELFLKKSGSQISTKPIKGTIRRGISEAEDRLLKENLHTSLKERTENVMAVDVARNDLSHFAKKGSVQVNKLYNIETFETVHQMVSTISCDVKEGTGFDDVLHATFPMASMTGAPKLRAMNLIDEYEDFERGIYSGALGLIDEKGDYTLSVVIRSIFYNQKRKHLSLAVGGAITYLSEPEKEYEECLLKAGAMLKALGAVLSSD